jgi:hypothetical protein
LSIHSGSDKFTVFPSIGRHTHGRVHVKTAGTNWLEALRVIARVAPSLYREMHAFALDHFAEATRYYHVAGKPENIPVLATLTDEQLPGLFDQDDCRQVLHITYGLILTAKQEDGSLLFKNRLYRVLEDHDMDYCQALKGHIGKHIEALLK